MSTSIEICNDMLRVILTPGISKPKKQSPKKLLTEDCQLCGRRRQVAARIPIFAAVNCDFDGRVVERREYAPLCAHCARRGNQ